MNATGGATVTTSGSQVATVTVQSNDHPYGLFTFSSAFRPLGVSEDVGEVEVMVIREFGMLGTVNVGFASVERGHNSLQRLDLAQLELNRYVGLQSKGMIHFEFIHTTLCLGVVSAQLIPKCIIKLLKPFISCVCMSILSFYLLFEVDYFSFK